ncbi:MAG TPA: hypothetical protein VM581_01535 [Magnetospirillaceae bacterium]|nr:hypothetical protein [Magnetospirillaceae bacterium]
MPRLVPIKVTATENGFDITAEGYSLTFLDVQRIKAQLRQYRNIRYVERSGDRAVSVWALGSKHAQLASEVKKSLKLYASVPVTVYTTQTTQVGSDKRIWFVGVVIRQHLMPAEYRALTAELTQHMSELRQSSAVLKKLGQRYCVFELVTPYWFGIDWRDDLYAVHLDVLEIHSVRYSAAEILIAFLEKSFPT